MAYVALDRRFSEWSNSEPPDADIRHAMGLEDGAVDWEELLTKRRVILLAEAGSGKSTEMTERARLTAESGKFAFHVTVEDVGRNGLEGALSLKSRANFALWRASTDTAWFFIDSVDEAKSSRIRLEKVLRKLADGIEGAEARTHLILSGRLTDWEFRKDLNSLTEWLPVPVRHERTPEEELLRIVKQEERWQRKKPLDPERPFVALMTPLDRNRVRLFAQAKGTSELDPFLEQIEAAHLWHFARRPLDLDWLVRFWQSEGRLGSLAEMVERSVAEQLKETNRDRARNDTLSETGALQAVERIGAAMVFTRKATIAIPDSEIAFTSDSPLDLADVLPDWYADDRTVLLSRPLFDPATLGRVRFHNDNEGIVRGYLTARWLVRLRSANLSTTELFELLFAVSYGLDAVKPSCNETVAWLALWDQDVASEVVRRNPLLLLSAGDPASLPPDVRRNALVGVMKELSTANGELPWLNNDRLRRFAHPDLGSVIVALWPEYRVNKEAAQLLMRIAWLGALKECAGLAKETAMDPAFDPQTRFFAGKALFATGEDTVKKEYASFVLTGHLTLPVEMVGDAIFELFPTFIGVGSLLAILGSTDIAGDRAGLRFGWEGPRLADRLESPFELEQLLDGLLMQLGGRLGNHAHHAPTQREEVYFPAIITAAVRLLKLSAPEIAPQVAIDAVLRVNNRRNHRSDLQGTLEAAFTELHRTPLRRRSTFWRVAETLRSSSREQPKIEHLWEMRSLGYSAGLQIEDVDWLLEDGLVRNEHDRRLAISSALEIQRSAGALGGLLEKIRAAANTDALAQETYESWMQMQKPFVVDSEFEREIEETDLKNNSEKAKMEQGWIDFVQDLQSDNSRIERLKVPQSPGVNTDLLDLWRLLDGASDRSGYGIDNLIPLVKIAGTEVAEAARQGFIEHWKQASPVLRSQKNVSDQNSVPWVDIMGITGVSLEAASDAGWAKKLSRHQATLAVGYATLELNGFPPWLPALAASWPEEVCAVLNVEIVDELSRPDLIHHDMLSKVANADNVIVGLVAPGLLKDLETRTDLSIAPLSHVLQIIVRGIQPESTPRFVTIGIERFERESDFAVAAQYLAAVFCLESATATGALKNRHALLNAGEQAKLTDRFLSAAFSDSTRRPAFKPRDVSARTLEDLVQLTFKTNTQGASRRRLAGEVYQVDSNDLADRARSAVFNEFVNTPGAATFHALLRLQSDPACPIAPARLRALAKDRATQDSEGAAWMPSEVLAFEQHHQSSPRTPKDLQSVLLWRLKDMQHDLVHGDFAQGLTLKALPAEVDVQNWVADRLRLKQGRSFSVEREPHVAGEKEPDIRIRAKATDASVALEIKVVGERWTLQDLEDALKLQLCDRYLRAKDGRYGVLLLVHQNTRSKGWKDSTGVLLTFSEVVARLSAQAAVIAGADNDSPQPMVCVLDMSTCRAKE